jgi:ubiquinone/menaquinone biosynthesis C-methylase UbiE
LNPGSTVKVDTMTDNSEVLAPNHHGDHAGFAGISGWVAALSMRIGRSGDAQLAIDLTALAPGEHVLDIGCGPGVAARAAAARGAVVTGVDPADVMLRVARRDDRHGAVTWKRGAAEALPVPDRSCDVVWSLATVHHWPDLDGGLTEVRRVLRADGRFLAIERRVQPGARGHASHGWTDRQAAAFADRCRDAGFELVAVTSHETKRGVLLAVLARATV